MYSFTTGEILCQEGQACENALVISSGEVEIAAAGTTRIASAGEIIGAASLIRGEAYRETVTALSAVEITLLTFSDLEAIISRIPSTTQQVKSQNTPVSSPDEVAPALERVIQMLYKCCETIEKKLDNFSDNKADESTLGSYENFSLQKKVGAADMGVIQSLIEDEGINDILINGPDNIFVERAGLLQKTDIAFNNDGEVFKVAENIVKAIGRKIDSKRPLIDARLLDGSRVNIIAPPLAVDGTSISIRKFSKKEITLDTMRDRGNVSEQLSEFLKVVGKCRLNIIISGGTGSGKTTLLNAISQHIHQEERIVTIEDAAELRLQQPHVVRLETKPHHPGMRVEDSVSIRDLVKNALRMRPDRIIIGEVRGPEAFDMMQAMNSGHEGSLTTIHANHPRDALSRLENMISMADLQIPIKSLRYQIAAALHLIVQISRMRDGQRRITYISEVVGMEGDMITMHDLFNYKVDGENINGKIVGKFKWSGIVPRFVRRVDYYGETARLENALGVKFPKVAIKQ